MLIEKETTVINFTAIVTVVDSIDIINSLCTLSGGGFEPTEKFMFMKL